jgi:pimeloyl-ACP methyl ester carboxylesterase
MARVLLLLLVAIGLAAPAKAQAPDQPFSTDDLLKGTRVDRDTCAKRPGTVFVAAMGQEICVAYGLAGVERGKQPVVYLPGDSLAPIGGGRMRVLDGYEGQTPALIANAGRVWAQRLNAPIIFLGRLGMHGTSGWHADRHSQVEVAIANRALDAIKARHGFSGFHLVGQSGGGLVGIGLAARRADLGCVVLASTPLDARAFYKRDRLLFRTTGGLANLDPMAEVKAVAERRSTALFLVGDPGDTVVPYSVQSPYAPALTAAGGRATVIKTPARDAKRHALVEKSFFIARDCLARRPADAIKARFEALGPTSFGD